MTRDDGFDHLDPLPIKQPKPPHVVHQGGAPADVPITLQALGFAVRAEDIRLPKPPSREAPRAERLRWIQDSVTKITEGMVVIAEYWQGLRTGEEKKRFAVAETRRLLGWIKANQRLLPRPIAWAVFLALDRMAPRLVEHAFQEMKRRGWVFSSNAQ